MKINRKTKTKFPAPGNKMSPLPDIVMEASSSNFIYPSAPLEQNSNFTYQDSKTRESQVTRLVSSGRGWGGFGSPKTPVHLSLVCEFLCCNPVFSLSPSPTLVLSLTAGLAFHRRHISSLGRPFIVWALFK